MMTPMIPACHIFETGKYETVIDWQITEYAHRSRPLLATISKSDFRWFATRARACPAISFILCNGNDKSIS